MPNFWPNWTIRVECRGKSLFTFLSMAPTELIVTALATAERQTKNVENFEKFSLTL